MLAIARANAAAEIDVPVPDVHFHDPAVLLAAPEVRPGAIPERPAPVPPPGPLRRARIAAGKVIGPSVSVVFGGLILGWGRIAGYRDEVWTNWYRRRVSLGVLTLGYMRERLNAHNLRSTYPRRSLIGFQEPGQTPPPGVRHFRTADGSWNNLSDPKEGAAGTRFPRNVANAAIRPETGERLMTPNPREISRKLLARGDEMKVVPFLNMLAAVWIQFQNHDWISHGENLVPGVLEVPLAEDDPARRRYGQTTMYVARTQPDPTRRPQDTTPITFINELTHWWDGSQIYGSDQATQDRLRSGVGRQAAAPRRRHPPPHAKAGRGHRDGAQLVGGAVDVPPALRQRAQRDLRPPQGRASGLGRHPPVQRGPARQRGGDGEDPQRRVDARHPPEPGPDARAERQLVRPPHQRLPAPGRAQDGLRPEHPEPRDGRRGREPDRQARLALRPHRGVRGGLPAALPPARDAGHPARGKLRCRGGDPVPGRPPGGVAQDHRARPDARPLALLRHPAPRAARAQQLPDVHAGAEHPRQPALRHGHGSTSCARGSAAFPATTSSGASWG